MATNDFLPFATGGSANVYTNAEYVADTDHTNGNQSGIAKSKLVNKALRQCSIISTVVAQYISDITGNNAVDDGTTATLLADLKTATNIATNTHAATSKTTPADSDEFPLVDSAASNGLKKLTFGNFKTALNSLFAPIASPVFTGTPTAKDFAYKNTPITITSWSYTGTTITLNVSSHTFVAGDYIEVSGLTATTYPANGIQLVTSVTSTTIVFTLSATPTGTAGVSSATVKGYATINGRVGESIGINQSWTDVVGSRALATTYTNTTGKPIIVSILFGSGGTTAGQYVYISVGGVQVAWNGMQVSSQYTGLSVVVPNGATYLAGASSGTPGISFWKELR